MCLFIKIIFRNVGTFVANVFYENLANILLKKLFFSRVYIIDTFGPVELRVLTYQERNTHEKFNVKTKTVKIKFYSNDNLCHDR